MNGASTLQIANLTLDVMVGREPRRIVDDVSLRLEEGGALGLVGESGSGKSMTLRTVMRLLPARAMASGEVVFEGESVLGMDRARLRRYRATEVGLIHQDPRASVNPVRTVGDFLLEGLRDRSRQEGRRLAIAALHEVGIPDGERRLSQFPHQLSGGLLQRVMIAAAILPGPRLLLADEPTTALDVTTQAEVMALIDEERRQRGLALLFVTHDLDLAAAVTDTLAVMYAGTIVETGRTGDVQSHPLHPYTAGLMASRPSLTENRRLQPIAGRPIAAYEAGRGCAFASRCPFVQERCRQERPALRLVDQRSVRCHRAEELRPQLASVLEESS